jgi:hypothetical protein
MKNRAFLIVISTAMLVASLVFTACNSKSPATADSITSANTANTLQPVALASSPGTIDSTQITLSSGVSSGTVDLEALDQQQSLVTFDAVSSDPSLLTSPITLSTPSEAPSSDPEMINLYHQAYKFTPQNISFDGFNQLQFQVNGTSHAKSLNGWEQDMMDWIDTFRNYANEPAGGDGGGGGSDPIQFGTNSASSNSDYLTQTKSVDLNTMTDQEIKQWLKDKGYKVKKLGNRTFELTKVIGKKTPSHKLYIHSLFDANSGEMVPIGITKNNKKVAKTLVKTRNGKRTEITQTMHSLFKKNAKKVYMKISAKNKEN